MRLLFIVLVLTLLSSMSSRDKTIFTLSNIKPGSRHVDTVYSGNSDSLFHIYTFRYNYNNEKVLVKLISKSKVQVFDKSPKEYRVVQEIYFDTLGRILQTVKTDEIKFDPIAKAISYNVNELRFNKEDGKFSYIKLMRDFKLILGLHVFHDSLWNFTNETSVPIMEINNPRTLNLK